MDFRESLSAVLPPRRSDEPEGLRQDILDELADHLTCSYYRELLGGSDSTNARARALERFGDPAAVARRLWLDAMKGRIMAQRILIATCVLVTAASLSLVGLFWQQLISAQKAAAAQRADALASQKEMLKQLQAMSEAVRNPRSLDWNPLKFQLKEGTPDGPPVAGVEVFLSKSNSGNGGGVFGRTLKSDSSGIVDFGLVNPGEFTFDLRQQATHFGDASRLASVPVSIRPGSETFKHIVCPKTPPEQAPVTVTCAWPAGLEKEGLVLCVSFAYVYRRFSGLDWRLGLAHVLMVDPETPPVEILGGRRPYLWQPSPQPGQSSGQPETLADVRQASLRAPDGPSGSFQWELGSYWITSMIVLRPAKDPSASPAWKRYQVVAGCSAQGAYADLQQLSVFSGSEAFFRIHYEPPEGDNPDKKTKQRGGGNQGRSSGQGGGDPTVSGRLDWIPPRPGPPVRVESLGKVYQALEVGPGKVNEWMVSLPDELITFVRDTLKNQKTSDARP